MSRRHVPLLLSVLALAAALVLVLHSASRADEGAQTHIVYLSITDEGPNAKAWYKGAPPAGVLVQDALDHFSSEGYHVAEVRAYQRSVVTVVHPEESSLGQGSGQQEYFIVLLEK